MQMIDAKTKEMNTRY